MKNKVAKIYLTKDELEVLLYIIDDWQWWKSDEKLMVQYPNKSTTSTRLMHQLNLIYKKFSLLTSR